MTDREGGGIKMDKYDVFINRFCKNPRSATAMGELDWQRKVREELFNLFTVGYINRIQACPKCGPKWNKKYAAFKKEAKEALRLERLHGIDQEPLPRRQNDRP